MKPNYRAALDTASPLRLHSDAHRRGASEHGR